MSSDADVTLYWIRTNSQGSDNAAIQQTPLDTQYRYADEIFSSQIFLSAAAAQEVQMLVCLSHLLQVY